MNQVGTSETVKSSESKHSVHLLRRVMGWGSDTF